MGQTLLIELILGHVFPKGIAAHFAEVNEIITNLLKESPRTALVKHTPLFMIDTSLVNYMSILMLLEFFRF